MLHVPFILKWQNPILISNYIMFLSIILNNNYRKHLSPGITILICHVFLWFTFWNCIHYFQKLLILLFVSAKWDEYRWASENILIIKKLFSFLIAFLLFKIYTSEYLRIFWLEIYRFYPVKLNLRNVKVGWMR